MADGNDSSSRFLFVEYSGPEGGLEDFDAYDGKVTHVLHRPAVEWLLERILRRRLILGMFQDNLALPALWSRMGVYRLKRRADAKAPRTAVMGSYEGGASTEDTAFSVGELAGMVLDLMERQDWMDKDDTGYRSWNVDASASQVTSGTMTGDLHYKWSGIWTNNPFPRSYRSPLKMLYDARQDDPLGKATIPLWREVEPAGDGEDTPGGASEDEKEEEPTRAKRREYIDTENVATWNVVPHFENSREPEKGFSSWVNLRGDKPEGEGEGEGVHDKDVFARGIPYAARLSQTTMDDRLTVEFNDALEQGNDNEGGTGSPESAYNRPFGSGLGGVLGCRGTVPAPGSGSGIVVSYGASVHITPSGEKTFAHGGRYAADVSWGEQNHATYWHSKGFPKFLGKAYGETARKQLEKLSTCEPSLATLLMGRHAMPTGDFDADTASAIAQAKRNHGPGNLRSPVPSWRTHPDLPPVGQTGLPFPYACLLADMSARLDCLTTTLIPVPWVRGEIRAEVRLEEATVYKTRYETNVPGSSPYSRDEKTLAKAVKTWEGPAELSGDDFLCGSYATDNGGIVRNHGFSRSSYYNREESWPDGERGGTLHTKETRQTVEMRTGQGAGVFADGVPLKYAEGIVRPKFVHRVEYGASDDGSNPQTSPLEGDYDMDDPPYRMSEAVEADVDEDALLLPEWLLPWVKKAELILVYDAYAIDHGGLAVARRTEKADEETRTSGSGSGERTWYRRKGVESLGELHHGRLSELSLADLAQKTDPAPSEAAPYRAERATPWLERAMTVSSSDTYTGSTTAAGDSNISTTESSKYSEEYPSQFDRSGTARMFLRVEWDFDTTSPEPFPMGVDMKPLADSLKAYMQALRDLATARAARAARAAARDGASSRKAAAASRKEGLEDLAENGPSEGPIEQAAQAELDAAQAELDAARTTKDTAQARSDEAHDDLDAAQAELDAARNEDDVDRTMDAAAAVSEATEKADAADAALADAEIRLDYAQAAYQEALANRDAAHTADAEWLAGELEKAEEELEKAEEELEKAEEELEKAEEELEKAEESLAEARKAHADALEQWRERREAEKREKRDQGQEGAS